MKHCLDVIFISLLPTGFPAVHVFHPSLSQNTMSHVLGPGTVLLPLVIGSTACGVAELRTLVRAAGGNWHLWLRYMTPTLRRDSRKLPLEYHRLGCMLEDVPQSMSQCCGMEEVIATLFFLRHFIS